MMTNKSSSFYFLLFVIVTFKPIFKVSSEQCDLNLHTFVDPAKYLYIDNKKLCCLQGQTESSFTNTCDQSLNISSAAQKNAECQTEYLNCCRVKQYLHLCKIGITYGNILENGTCNSTNNAGRTGLIVQNCCEECQKGLYTETGCNDVDKSYALNPCCSQQKLKHIDSENQKFEILNYLISKLGFFSNNLWM